MEIDCFFNIHLLKYDRMFSCQTFENNVVRLIFEFHSFSEAILLLHTTGTVNLRARNISLPINKSRPFCLLKYSLSHYSVVVEKQNGSY